MLYALIRTVAKCAHIREEIYAWIDRAPGTSYQIRLKRLWNSIIRCIHSAVLQTDVDHTRVNCPQKQPLRYVEAGRPIGLLPRGCEPHCSS
ncbi:hypothetical protein I7I53_00368 [Histoplasma capsulatum var. duboisii H88]|uniref:Uncharacterized protein n=1 Tax=Ajellomyces capsulatus (strain H88) TaxID=544711 RepID=A0A8A1LI68_AJEC8|nr:hypothetical protein I7I53_00368 [Histoplasma capsulatum var. duboisii H88]